MNQNKNVEWYLLRSERNLKKKYEEAEEVKVEFENRSRIIEIFFSKQKEKDKNISF